MICFNPKGTARRINSLSDPGAQQDRMAPSGRVCNGDERLIIPSWSKCDGDDVEQVPFGVDGPRARYPREVCRNDRKLFGILNKLFRYVSHEVSDTDVALILQYK